ncbi:MAG TPA: hypothetical protein VHL11_19205, partial [Phototrophicaceae bacterium]|nr:hypothetical protein [Phototrophicaceae bacterium]
KLIFDPTADNTGVGATVIPVWLDNRTFILDHNLSTEASNRQDSLIEITSTDVKALATEIGSVIGVNPFRDNQDQFLITRRSENDNHEDWLLYNASTAAAIPLASIPDKTNQSVSFEGFDPSGAINMCIITPPAPPQTHGYQRDCYTLNPEITD